MSSHSPADALRNFRQQQAELYKDGRCDALLGDSPAMFQLRSQVDAAAISGANVLVVGAQLDQLAHIAEAIHYRGHPAGEASLLRVDTAVALPSELSRTLNTLLSDKIPGTLFIESVEHLPAEQQSELLTALASSNWAGQVIASQLNPPATEAAGVSDELLAALSTITICVPPLSVRPEDIPQLVAHYLDELGESDGEPARSITPDALDLLMIYSWPGEIRELRDVVTSAYGRSRGTHVAPGDLPKVVHHAMQSAELVEDQPQPIDLDAYLAEVETLLVSRALELAEGNKAEAARLLGVSRPRLYRKLDQMASGADAPSERGDKPAPPTGQQEPPTPEDGIEFVPLEGE